LAEINLINLVTQYREQYNTEHPQLSSFGLQPTVKLDIFGNPIQEMGSLDQLEVVADTEKFQKDRDIWVFRKILDDTEGQCFQELVAMMGNPDNLHPCDGFLWPQCTFFCSDYPECQYYIESQKPKVEVEIKAAVAGQSDQKKAKKKRRKKK